MLAVGAAALLMAGCTPLAASGHLAHKRSVAAPKKTAATPAAAPSVIAPTPVASPTTASPAPDPTPTPTCSVSLILVSSCGIWWGAAANPLAGETWDQALATFELTQGRLDDVLHYYHVGAALFPSATELNRARAGGTNRLLMENWKPEQGRTWAQVAAGDPVVDAAIDNEASYLKAHFTAKFFLSIHHEPEDEVKPAVGSGFTAGDYRRHVPPRREPLARRRRHQRRVRHGLHGLTEMGQPELVRGALPR